eukprot:99106_1
MFRSLFLASILAALVFGAKKCRKDQCINGGGDCVKGSLVQCFVDPCDATPCTSGTYCTPNYCNGCNRVCNSCFTRGGCLDAKGCEVVTCFVDPCDIAQCPKGSVCKSNYCGGCNHVCVKP